MQNVFDWRGLTIRVIHARRIPRIQSRHQHSQPRRPGIHSRGDLDGHARKRRLMNFVQTPVFNTMYENGIRWNGRSVFMLPGPLGWQVVHVDTSVFYTSVTAAPAMRDEFGVINFG